MQKGKDFRRVEARQEIQAYIDRLRYACNHAHVPISFIRNRRVDQERDKKYTNSYTVNKLFPDEDVVSALKRELCCLSVEDYVETVEDQRFPNRSEMRVFGKQYSDEDVYIKIRTELFDSQNGDALVLVMSFHFAEWTFRPTDFHYK